MGIEHRNTPSLDIGCGEGSSIGAYDTESLWVGVDVDSSTIRTISGKYPDHSFVIADAAHLPFRDGAFGHVTAAHV